MEGFARGDPRGVQPTRTSFFSQQLPPSLQTPRRSLREPWFCGLTFGEGCPRRMVPSAGKHFRSGIRPPPQPMLCQAVRRVWGPQACSGVLPPLGHSANDDAAVSRGGFLRWPCESQTVVAIYPQGNCFGLIWGPKNVSCSPTCQWCRVPCSLLVRCRLVFYPRVVPPACFLLFMLLCY